MSAHDTTIRQGIITELATRTNKRHQNLGKTALQKHIYFLQEVFGVDCGYEFRLYTYGPFCADLLSDLDTLEFVDGVDMTYDSSVRGYRIRPGANAALVREEARAFLKESSAAIDEVLDNFGDLSAKDLELRATIVYAEREAIDELGKPSLKDLAKTVQSIKPHFSIPVIVGAIEELQKKQYVRLA